MWKPKIIDDPSQVKLDDKVVAVMGPTGSGKSHLIDHLTKSTKLAGSTLRSVTQDVFAIRIQLDKSNIVLVDTPGFDDTYRSDITILELIGQWLKKTYENDIRLTGILYLHRITDNRMAGTAFRNLRMFGTLCGNNPAEKVIFVTTMWDKIPSDKGRQRESELRNTYWDPMLKLGAKSDRFIQGDKDSAQKILRRLVDPRTRATLFQQEIVDKKRAIVETEAARTLYTQTQTLLTQHKETLAQLREDAMRTNDPQAIADLEKEQQRIQAELDNTFHQAKKLKVSLLGRLKLFFSGNAKSRAVEFTC